MEPKQFLYQGLCRLVNCFNKDSLSSLGSGARQEELAAFCQTVRICLDPSYKPESPRNLTLVGCLS